MLLSLVTNLSSALMKKAGRVTTRTRRIFPISFPYLVHIDIDLLTAYHSIRIKFKIVSKSIEPIAPDQEEVNGSIVLVK